MNATAYEHFFLRPTDPLHRRYEALRALFVDQRPLKEIAQRFAVSYGTMCNWVSEFRNQWDADQRPPFLISPLEDDHPVLRTTVNRRNLKLSMPMFRLCRWKPAAAYVHATREFFCSCRCWHNSAWIGS